MMTSWFACRSTVVSFNTLLCTIQLKYAALPYFLCRGRFHCFTPLRAAAFACYRRWLARPGEQVADLHDLLLAGRFGHCFHPAPQGFDGIHQYPANVLGVVLGHHLDPLRYRHAVAAALGQAWIRERT